MNDPTEQLKIITNVKYLLSHLTKDASPETKAVIAEIIQKLTDLEYSLVQSS
jgi:hypothetical protein